MKNAIYLILIGIGLQVTVGCSSAMLDTEITESDSFQAQWVEVPSNEGLEDSYNDMNPEEEEIQIEGEEEGEEEGAIQASNPVIQNPVVVEEHQPGKITHIKTPGLKDPKWDDGEVSFHWEAEEDPETIDDEHLTIGATHKPATLKWDPDPVIWHYGAHPDSEEDDED
ncbi:MAG: hypothetical protein R3257_05905 [bacterium]|nr:hypothetical protein [bacterium]